MLKNYVVIAWRNLTRRSFFSALNITGLAIAMAFSILIFLWIQDERSVDQFHQNGDRLFRVLQSQFYDDGKVTISDQTTALLVDALKQEMPEVEKAAMVSQLDRWTVGVGDRLSKEQGCYASEDLFQMFTFPLLKGDPENILVSGDEIVISQKVALRYFGKSSPMGKAIRIDNRKDYFVSGVFADIPENSSLRFDILLPYKEYQELPWAGDWAAIGDRVFLLLRDKSSYGHLKGKITHFLKSKSKENDDRLTLQPYPEMYLYSDFQDGIQQGGRISYVNMFSVVAILIVVVAAINFMNLSTVQSLKRSREIGIRKVVGASRFLLIRQFLAEALLIAAISAGLSLVLVEVTQPLFGRFTGKEIQLRYGDPVFIAAISAVVVATGLIAGIYPALYLSSLQPAKIFRGTLKLKGGGPGLGKILVITQFSLSIIFILCTIVVYEQLKYLRTKDLGLDREDVIYQVFEGELAKNFTAFKTELSQLPGIESVTYSNQSLLGISYPSTWIEWPGKKSEMVFATAGVSYDYCRTLKIELVEGRDFSPAVVNDTSNVLINEAALKRMGIADPIGHEITTRRDIIRKGKIIGVMKDFHLQSLHTPIEPLCLFLDSSPGFGFITVRTERGRTKEAIASMERVNKKYNPGFPFEYTFADADYRRKYISEEILSNLARAFSFLAIFISCLGLFGLAAYTAEQRTKEIGIRKVLGATVSGIIRLLSADFIKLVVIAFIVAIPVAWYAMSGWLKGYAYRIDISFWIIFAAGAVSLLIAVLTVGSQAIKVARRNPVDSLRSE